MSKKLARGNFLIPVLYLLDPRRTVFHTNMVRTSRLGKLRMRKQNIKTIVPLDVVPERRTKRFPPSSRPGDRFVRQGSDTCALAAGEINISSQTMYDRSLSSTRPIDQVEQFLFKINSVPAISSVWSVQVCQRMCSYNWTRLKGHSYASLVVFHTVYSGAYWHKIDGIYACAFRDTLNNPFYFFPRGHGNEFINLIGSLGGPDFPISARGHGDA